MILETNFFHIGILERGRGRGRERGKRRGFLHKWPWTYFINSKSSSFFIHVLRNQTDKIANSEWPQNWSCDKEERARLERTTNFQKFATFAYLIFDCNFYARNYCDDQYYFAQKYWKACSTQTCCYNLELTFLVLNLKLDWTNSAQKLSSQSTENLFSLIRNRALLWASWVVF